MGIRFDYQVGAGMIGAYAAGQQESRRRRQKYAFTAALQQQRLGAVGTRYGGLGSRRAAGRGGALGAQEGVWTDPLATTKSEQGALANVRETGIAAPMETRRELIRKRAAGRARDRKARLGKPIPPEWQPTFTSQDDIDQAKIDRKEAEARGDTQRAARIKHLTPIPPELAKIAPELNRELVNKLAGIQRMVLGKEWDENDPETQKALDDAIQEYEDLIENAPQADPNQGGYVWDDAVGWRKTTQGEKPTHSWDGPGTQPQMTEEYAAERKQAEVDAKELAKQKLDAENELAAWQTARNAELLRRIRHWDGKEVAGETLDLEGAKDRAEADMVPWDELHPKPPPYEAPTSSFDIPPGAVEMGGDQQPGGLSDVLGTPDVTTLPTPVVVGPEGIDEDDIR